MKKTIPVFVLIFSLLGAVIAAACSDESCENRYELIRAKLKRARVVFVGKVISIDRNENLQDVQFTVSKVYKGYPGPEVVVNTDRVGSSEAVCGNDFRVGEEYLVYAYGLVSQPGDAYSVETCGGTKKLTCADYDLQELKRMGLSDRL